MAGRFVDAAVVTCAGARDGSYETLRSARGQLPGKCVGIVSSSSLLPIASFFNTGRYLTCSTDDMSGDPHTVLLYRDSGHAACVH